MRGRESAIERTVKKIISFLSVQCTVYSVQCTVYSVQCTCESLVVMPNAEEGEVHTTWRRTAKHMCGRMYSLVPFTSLQYLDDVRAVQAAEGEVHYMY